MLRKPQSMTGAALYWEGQGFLGTTKEVKFPDIEFIKWTSNSGIGERSIDTSLLKEMTVSIVLEEYNEIYWTQLAKRHFSKSFFHVKQNITSGIRNIPVVATFAGNIMKMSLPKHENAQAVNVSFDIDVSFFKYDYDHKNQFTIDLENMIFFAGGVDVYADMRFNLF